MLRNHCFPAFPTYFNSIKVQFEQQFDQDFGEFIDNFNSIKVQFELGKPLTEVRGDEYFNSIKVQFERSITPRLSVLTCISIP